MRENETLTLIGREEEGKQKKVKDTVGRENETQKKCRGGEIVERNGEVEKERGTLTRIDHFKC